jgi:hypothetical protein
MRPMTIVVVREEPAGGSETGAGAGVAGAAAAVVAGAAADVSGAVALVAGVGAAVEAGAAGLAVVWARETDAARRSTARTAGSAERRFMAGETIGRARMRQASRRAA